MRLYAVLWVGLAACAGGSSTSATSSGLAAPPVGPGGLVEPSHGATTIDYDLVVGGTCTLGDQFHDTLTGRDLIVGRNETVSGNLSVNGNLQVSGSTYFTTNVQGVVVPEFQVSAIYDDWCPDGWASNEIFRVQAADNEGTRITGAMAGNPGDVRILVNMSDPIDDGVLVLLHESSRSQAANRFHTPNEEDYIVPKNGAVTLWYDGVLSRWVVLNRGSRTERLVAQSIGVFPDALSDVLSGQIDDWNPVAIAAQNTTYSSGLGAAGDSLLWKDNSLWRVQVASSGATLTGMQGYDNASPAGFHPIKIILNYGPGPLTFKNSSPSSATLDQLQLPGNQDLVLPPLGSAVFIWVYGWKLIALGQPNGNGIVTASSVTTNALTTSSLVAASSITPSPLAPGQINDWVPAGIATTARIRVAADLSGTTLTGMAGVNEGMQVGTVEILTNFGGPLTLTHLDPSSDPTRRFLLPNAASLTIPVYGSVTLTYDETQTWVVTGKSF